MFTDEKIFTVITPKTHRMTDCKRTHIRLEGKREIVRSVLCSIVCKLCTV